MQQLLKHGFYLSFGFHFHTDSLSTCPAERLFLETDEEPRPVSELYATAATLRATTPEALNQQCWSNAQVLIHHSSHTIYNL
jgi:TatD DNase family protein